MLFKKSSNATLVPREVRDQVLHVLDPDSDYRDTPDSNDDHFRIQTSNWLILVLLERASRELPNAIGSTSKLVTRKKRRPKPYITVAETGPEFQSKAAASPLIGPKGLVRIRVQFWVSWGHAPTSLAATQASSPYMPP